MLIDMSSKKGRMVKNVLFVMVVLLMLPIVFGASATRTYSANGATVTVTIVGGINENQSGLTVGKKYFLGKPSLFSLPWIRRGLRVGLWKL